TLPELQRHATQANQGKLAEHKPNQPPKRRFHETVTVQADAQHVHAEPRPARDDVAEDGAIDEPALANDSTPAQVKNQRVPKNDDQRAVFLRVPAPEATPGLVCPDAAQNRAHETEQRGEANDAVDHFSQARTKLRCCLSRSNAITYFFRNPRGLNCAHNLMSNDDG